MGSDLDQEYRALGLATKWCRERKGFTAEQAVKACSEVGETISLTWLQNVEHAKRPWTIRKWWTLLRALGYDWQSYGEVLDQAIAFIRMQPPKGISDPQDLERWRAQVREWVEDDPSAREYLRSALSDFEKKDAVGKG